jgi:hypothetical protein
MSWWYEPVELGFSAGLCRLGRMKRRGRGHEKTALPQGGFGGCIDVRVMKNSVFGMVGALGLEPRTN